MTTAKGPDIDRVRLARLWRNEIKMVRAQGWSGPVAGVDEAGRGPLAGPVVAAAVVLPRRHYFARLDDSKRLSAATRGELAAVIRERAIDWAVAEVSVADIDQINILYASHKAMRQALLQLQVRHAVEAVLVDGLAVSSLGFDHLAVVGGDSLCPSIAAASVLAKVHRDALMEELDRFFPQYGFARHKGYPTPEHIAALRRHGPCEAHRRSFRCRQLGLFDVEVGFSGAEGT